MTTLTRSDLALLVETLAGSPVLSVEQWKWVARLRRESGSKDPAWDRLVAVARAGEPTTVSLRELLELQHER